MQAHYVYIYIAVNIYNLNHIMVRIIGTIVVFVLCFNNASSQNYIYQQKDKLKAGVYKSYSEFKTNSPSISWDFTINPRTIGYGFLNASGYISGARIVMSKNKRKELGFIYGFCDGTNIYISESRSMSKLKKTSYFHRVEYLGKLVYFEDVFSSSTANGGTVRSLDRKYLIVSSGKVNSLKKSTMRGILSHNTDLLKEFNAERYKNGVLKEYLIKYCEEEIEIQKQLNEEMNSF